MPSVRQSKNRLFAKLTLIVYTIPSSIYHIYNVVYVYMSNQVRYLILCKKQRIVYNKYQVLTLYLIAYSW